MSSIRIYIHWKPAWPIKKNNYRYSYRAVRYARFQSNRPPHHHQRTSRLSTRNTGLCSFSQNRLPTYRPSFMGKIFTACRNHGLNHIRFHSWCPPEAAFVQPTNGNVSGNRMFILGKQQHHYRRWETIGRLYIKRKRSYSENFWQSSLFLHDDVRQWTCRRRKQQLSGWIYLLLEKQDKRRIYSTAGGWPNLPVSDFLSDPSPRIQGWGQGLNSIINAQAPRTDYDWSEYINRFTQPIVSHEIGQWCVYPNFKEMKSIQG